MSTTTAVMTTTEIADRLVGLCKKGDFDAAQKELFAQDAVSIEAHATPAFEKETKGLDAILKKSEKWNAMVSEVHSIEISQPLIGENSFAITMSMAVSMKDGKKMDMKELCVYNVKDGKIASEQFFM